MKQYTDFDNHVEHRIRELEEQLEEHKAVAYAYEAQCVRIAKAKAILELLFAYETEAIPLTDYSVPKMVERALKALEGK